MASARCTDFGGCFRRLDQIRWSVAVDWGTDRIPDVVLMHSRHLSRSGARNSLFFLVASVHVDDVKLVIST